MIFKDLETSKIEEFEVENLESSVTLEDEDSRAPGDSKVEEFAGFQLVCGWMSLRGAD